MRKFSIVTGACLLGLSAISLVPCVCFLGRSIPAGFFGNTRFGQTFAAHGPGLTTAVIEFGLSVLLHLRFKNARFGSEKARK